MMRVYRIANANFCTLDGLGGMFSWGRWHNKGVRVIYTSENRALAAWEKIVHISELSLLPDDLIIMEIEIPEDEIIVVPKSVLVKGWNAFPYARQTVDFGTDFLRSNQALALKVPSVVSEEEYYYILNPNHKDISKCTIKSKKPFLFDSRASQ